ncbi:copper transporter [Actinotalea sp. BY-33]|uniref:Copper transporter n=1 Tax=Actinotalea soli TaxID=2819234 RepID=A0A939RS46_9CELL|nr:copper transporter [Actinotalea soli]MBO1750187.1 copper transporter [Actinotalea soli]
MIDFRYHLVSLISVFLALAVGIALGAGPLEQSIGDTLTGQVEQLRTEKDELRVELDRTLGELGHAETTVDEMAPAMLADTLGERRVAVIEVADVQPEVLEAVVSRVEQAGGTVTGTVQVTEAWTDPAQQSFRQQIAGTLLEYLDPVPADDAGTGVELAEALVQSLTTADPESPDSRAETSELVVDVLVEAELVTLEGEITGPADAVVVLAGPTVSIGEVEQAEAALASAPAEEAAEETERAEMMLTSALEISRAAQARSVGAVVAGGALSDASLVQRIRQDADAVAELTTVDGVQSISGQVAVPLALSARVAGTIGHYGPGAGATDAMPPRVVLPTIERVAPAPEEDETGAEDEGSEEPEAEG